MRSTSRMRWAVLPTAIKALEVPYQGSCSSLWFTLTAGPRSSYRVPRSRCSVLFHFKDGWNHLSTIWSMFFTILMMHCIGVCQLVRLVRRLGLRRLLTNKYLFRRLDSVLKPENSIILSISFSHNMQDWRFSINLRPLLLFRSLYWLFAPWWELSTIGRSDKAIDISWQIIPCAETKNGTGAYGSGFFFFFSFSFFPFLLASSACGAIGINLCFVHFCGRTRCWLRVGRPCWLEVIRWEQAGYTLDHSTLDSEETVVFCFLFLFYFLYIGTLHHQPVSFRSLGIYQRSWRIYTMVVLDGR